uniref:Putative tick transposon n=1 Tax=Rhipicephalus microplus TaxID=6941 RepID=A0A6G5A9E3_RHIMP
MIAAYIQPDHKNWDVVLPFVTFAYNTAIQRTTGYSPFYLVYGRSPTTFLDVSFFTCQVNSSPSSSEEYVSRLAQCRQRARINTEARQEDRKLVYDESHRDVSFQPGDEVLLLTPVRTPGLCDKFQPRFIGPYTVLEETSPVNYRVTPLVAPADRRYRTTEVVHVSRMKPFMRRSLSP